MEETADQMNQYFSNKIIMIEPTHFGTNYETIEDNTFMKELNFDVQPKALEEFNNFITNLSNKNVEVIVYKQPYPEAKDSIFPNNWFSTHKNSDFPEGLLIVYPLKSLNRRLERNPAIIENLKRVYKDFIDLSYLENEGEYLESTGSLIFDVFNKNIYCGVSERATEKALDTFINAFNAKSKSPYNLITFSASDLNDKTIYHTNVLLSVLEKHIVVCLEAIKNTNEREYVKTAIEQSKGKTLLEVSMNEMANFGCNIINLKSKDEKLKETLLIMSKTAYDNYSTQTKNVLQNEYDLVINDIPTIEQVGGGSSRCMIAEIC